ncbi:hypothetical protein RQP46_010374 [Phenoliferia psychrophenolica]
MPSHYSPPKSRSRTTSSTSSRHRTTSSTSSTSSAHAHIPAPEYPVRSQFALHRSTSSIEIQQPTISGGIARRMSLSSSEGGSDADEEDAAALANSTNRPIKHRSESLPMFPPPEPTSTSRAGMSLEDLPSNPKLWMPSHLSVYISHALDLHPLLEQDITAFIRTSRLSGRAFLRLRDDDMEAMGINIRWRPLLSEARDRLRREALGGKIWGFEGVRHGDNEGWESESSVKAQSVIGLFPEGAEEGGDTEQWKKSWRRTAEGQSSGRVRGMARQFETSPEEERGLPTSTSSNSLSSNRGGAPRQNTKRSSVVVPNATHGRSDSMASTTSTASIDSGSGADGGGGRAGSPFDFDFSDSNNDTDTPAIPFYPPDTPQDFGPSSTSPPEQYQSNMTSHFNDDVKPYQLVRRPSAPYGGGTRRLSTKIDTTMVRGPDGRMSIHDLAFVLPPEEETDDAGEPTIKSPVVRGPSSGLNELFGIDTRRSESEMQKIVDEGGDDEDLMTMQVGGRKGSMIFVRKSQLEGLQKRLEDVEAKLAEALATSPPSSEHGAVSTSDSKSPPSNLGGWILSSFARSSADEGDPAQFDPASMSWTGLGGYVIAASIGIGIIAGEVVVSKVFGFGNRR